jgi:hypothetical protein
MRYLTRQVAVDAIQWDGTSDTLAAIYDMVGEDVELTVIDANSHMIQMDTEMGVAYPEPGEWITWDGEFAQAYKDKRFKELFTQVIGTAITDGTTVDMVLSGAIPKTQEEKIAFRQYWDSRVDAAKEAGK